MPNQSKSKPTKITSIKQITNSHCGPAVVEMLLNHLDIPVSQEAITKAADAEKTIKKHGTNIYQLSNAVNKLVPSVTLWFKKDCSFEEIETILFQYNYPVAVEWQAYFKDKNEKIEDKTGYGHYSIISHIDRDKNEVIIADPHKDFVDLGRRVPLDIFIKRWWDQNEITYPDTGEKVLEEDYHMLFIITPNEEKFPSKLGMETH